MQIDEVPEIVPRVYVAHAISEPRNKGEMAWRDWSEVVSYHAHKIAVMGAVPIVPAMLGNVSWELALQLDYSLVSMSQAVFEVVGPYFSHGVEQEKRWANEDLDIPVFTDLLHLEDWLTERQLDE